MGACYSAKSADRLSPEDKLPKIAKKKNGVIVIQTKARKNSCQSDVSSKNDSLPQNLDSEANSVNENFKDMTFADDGKHGSQDTLGKSVVPSDSGIESLPSPPDELQSTSKHLSNSSCQEQSTTDDGEDYSKLSDLLKVYSKKGRRKDRKPSRKSLESLDWTYSLSATLDYTKGGVSVSDIFRDDVSLNAPLAAFDSTDMCLDQTLERKRRSGCKSFRASDISSNSDSSKQKPTILKRNSFHNDDSAGEHDVHTCSSGSSPSPCVSSDQCTSDLNSDKGSLRNSGIYDEEFTVDHRSIQCKLSNANARKRISVKSLSSLQEETMELDQIMDVVNKGEIVCLDIDGHEVVVLESNLFKELVDGLSTVSAQLSQLQDVIREDRFDGSVNGSFLACSLEDSR